MEVSRKYSRFNFKDDDFDFDFNDISRSSTPRSTISSRSEGRKHRRSHHRDQDSDSHSIDDYKRKIARLKSELDLEKARGKHVHKENSAELASLKETFEQQKQQELEEIESKLKEEKRRELEEIQEKVLKEKDTELRQVLKYKEEEVKQLKLQYSKEKEDEMQMTKEQERKKHEELERKLKEETRRLRAERKQWEEEYKKKCSEESRKEKEFTKVKDEYDSELRKILSESKMLAMGNLQKLKKAEKALSEGMLSDDDTMSMTLSECLTPFSELQSQPSSRTPSRAHSTRLEDMKLEDIDIAGLLASPISPSLASVTPSPLNQTYTLDAGRLPTLNEAVNETNKRLLDEKDRQLQKRVGELQSQIQRLERKIALVKTENESLKKKQDDQKPLEDKIKTLKKRNAELAAIARRLEEKAKHLQQENMKVQKTKTKEEGGIQDSEYLKKMFARQRAKDLAEHAKSMLAKDREIEDLRKKCQELADQLSNADFAGPENAQMYEEKEELVSIIKQAAKERLQLERQLTKNKPGAQVETRKVKELEETNETLKREILKLGRAIEETEKLEVELTQKKLECERLHQEIKKEKRKNKELESDLQDSAAENTQLTVQVSDLQKRLQNLEKVNEECNNLRLNLSEAQQECESAKQEVTGLEHKVKTLENEVKTLQDSTERLKHLEHDYQETIQRLQEKQAQIDLLQKAQEDAKQEYEQALRALQEKVRDLEHQCKLQDERQRELTAELTTLRSQAQRNKTSNSPAGRGTAESPRRRRSPASPLPNSSSPPNRPNSGRKSPQEIHAETVEPSVASQNEASSQGEISDGSKNCPADSTKSLDTGFADDEDEEVDNESNNPSPEPDKGDFDDPELYEIAKKLKELEASDTSDEENIRELEERDDSGMESNREQKSVKKPESFHTDSRLSSLAKKGPIQVFIARYSYNPFQYSPNENPEAELPLNAGDYVLIYGEMDEDGFFDGELIDGRRGLVPSNFIEKVADDDLPEFHAAVAGAAHHDDDSTAPNSIQQDLDFDSSEEAEKPEDFAEDTKKKVAQANGLAEIPDVEEESISITTEKLGSSSQPLEEGVPFPHKLSMDRQLTSSILISWRPPEGMDPDDVQSYHVFVDGDFKTSVRGSERTKALLENIDARKVHRVSVRSVSSKGQSKDNQCTILVGKDSIPAPSELSVSDITPNSATISWLPGNSNYQHSISVNGREVRVVRPGLYHHTLTGLEPATSHQVSVRAKSLTANPEDERNKLKIEMLSAGIDFETPAGGLPDPPLNVLVEAGPQEGTLLLTWLPVTIETSGFSNGAVVIGYVVYADGRRAKEAKGPTNDHIVLGADDFQGFIPKQLMVRTLTADKMESADSEIVRLPHSLIKEITAGAAKTLAAEVSRKSSDIKKVSPVPSEEGHDTDEEIEAAFREAAKVGHDTNQPFGGKGAFKNAGGSHRRSPHSPQSGGKVPTKAEDVTRSGRERDMSPSDSKSVQQSQEYGEDRTKMPARVVVPAIEITRDSSSERGASFEVSEDEPDTSGISKQRTVADHHRQEELAKVAHQSKSNEKQKHRPHSPKYSDEMDGRDGYREGHHDRERTHQDDSRRRNKEPHINENTTHVQSNGSPRISPRQHSGSPRRHSGGYHGNQDSNANEVNSSYSRVTPKKMRDSIPEAELLDFDDRDDVDSISGEINPPVDDNRVRLFVALFDYDPISMSPNVDAIDEELPFQEGQIIKIYGDKDADGFYRGESNGRIGFVPCNMVSEIQVDDPDLADQLLKESQEDLSVHSQNLVSKDKYSLKGEASNNSNHVGHSPRNSLHLSPNGIPPMPADAIERRMIAMYDYDPQELSPNVDAELELTFKTGDILMIYGEMDDDGFYMGSLNGQRGLVPSNFLQEAPLSDDDVLESVSVVSPARSGESINTAGSRQSSTADKVPNPKVETLPAKMEPPVDPLESSPIQSRSRSLSPDENRAKKKMGAIFNKGKSIFKKFTR